MSSLCTAGTSILLRKSQAEMRTMCCCRLKSLRVNITNPAIQSAPAHGGIVPASFRAAAYIKSGSTLPGRKAAPFIKGNASKGLPDATYFGLDCLELGPQIAMDARGGRFFWFLSLCCALTLSVGGFQALGKSMIGVQL